MKTPSGSLLVVVLVGGWKEFVSPGVSLYDASGSAFSGLWRSRCFLLVPLFGPSGVLNASPGLGVHAFKGFEKSQFGHYHFFVSQIKFDVFSQSGTK